MHSVAPAVHMGGAGEGRVVEMYIIMQDCSLSTMLTNILHHPQVFLSHQALPLSLPLPLSLLPLSLSLSFSFSSNPKCTPCPKKNCIASNNKIIN
jgi:hypothetical protein